LHTLVRQRDDAGGMALIRKRFVVETGDSGHVVMLSSAIRTPGVGRGDLGLPQGLHRPEGAAIIPRLSLPVLAQGSFVMKTISAKAETVKRDWYVVDASNKTLGRLCSEIARRLRGKHKTVFTPHVDTGDYIVVVNAQKVHVTGAKMDDKYYHRFTGYIGNLKSVSLKDMLASHPERVIEIGVKGMLPKNPLGRAMFKKLKVYGGAEHPHTAQQPQALDI
jgi:large subunit ribosomal protein L13